MAVVRGGELKLGDVVDTWAGKKRIVGLKPYNGPLAHLFPAGARLVDFDNGRMTVDNSELFDVVSFEAT